MIHQDTVHLFQTFFSCTYLLQLLLPRRVGHGVDHMVSSDTKYTAQITYMRLEGRHVERQHDKVRRCHPGQTTDRHLLRFPANRAYGRPQCPLLQQIFITKYTQYFIWSSARGTTHHVVSKPNRT